MTTTDLDVRWNLFAEFCRWDRAAGGPDPHMKVAAALVEDAPLPERLWMGGCYMGTYVVPSAEVIYDIWPAADVLDAGPEILEGWLSEHWEGIVLRRERRAVRTPAKLARFLHSYATWMSDGVPQWIGDSTLPPDVAYEMGWKDLNRVWGAGRYIVIKGLEYMALATPAQTHVQDIRAHDGWSPRRALTLLYPAYAKQLENPRSPVVWVESVATDCRTLLERHHDVSLSYYELQTFLCDWKQCYVGSRQYPGRSQDSELHHASSVFGYFTEHRTRLWETRARLFPEDVLGEANGWDGVREELTTCQSVHGYTWSDLAFDYHATRAIGDWANPVAKDWE